MRLTSWPTTACLLYSQGSRKMLMMHDPSLLYLDVDGAGVGEKTRERGGLDLWVKQANIS